MTFHLPNPVLVCDPLVCNSISQVKTLRAEAESYVMENREKEMVAR